jgi:hypothetical protein
MEIEITIINKEYKDGNGFKVIEVNVSNPAESLYAVCTPIKKL